MKQLLSISVLALVGAVAVPAQEPFDGPTLISPLNSSTTSLIDLDGEIIAVGGAKDKYSRGGDVSFAGCSGNIYAGNYLWWPGGSIARRGAYP